MFFARLFSEKKRSSAKEKAKEKSQRATETKSKAKLVPFSPARRIMNYGIIRTSPEVKSGVKSQNKDQEGLDQRC